MADQVGGARPIRMLDNQPVRTPPFAGHVTFLCDALPRWIGAAGQKAPQRGIVEGFVMFVVARRFDATITVGTGGSFAFGLLNRVFARKRRQAAKELYFDEHSLGSSFRSIGQVALLEAMAFGKPLVSANVMGALDYIEDGVNGLVCEPGNAVQLRGILLRLAAEEIPQHKLGRGALRRVKERFNNPAYSRAMLDLVERVCGVARQDR